MDIKPRYAVLAVLFLLIGTRVALNQNRIIEIRPVEAAANIPATLNLAKEVNSSNVSSTTFNSSSSVRDYVRKTAIAYGVSADIADFIILHESHYCFNNGYFQPDIPGDDGKSIGCWQIYLEAHKDISRACASDFVCSTAWAMPHILKEPAIWSTWRFRKEWYGVK